MNNTIQYKGYIGSVESSEEDGLFFGKVMGVRSLISYEGETAKELIADFHGAVDDYLEMCEAEHRILTNRSEAKPERLCSLILSNATRKAACIFSLSWTSPTLLTVFWPIMENSPGFEIILRLWGKRTRSWRKQRRWDAV